jgi:hypothetical protein
MKKGVLRKADAFVRQQELEELGRIDRVQNVTYT